MSLATVSSGGSLPKKHKRSTSFAPLFGNSNIFTPSSIASRTSISSSKEITAAISGEEGTKMFAEEGSGGIGETPQYNGSSPSRVRTYSGGKKSLRSKFSFGGSSKPPVSGVYPSSNGHKDAQSSGGFLGRLPFGPSKPSQRTAPNGPTPTPARTHHRKDTPTIVPLSTTTSLSSLNEDAQDKGAILSCSTPSVTPYTTLSAVGPQLSSNSSSGDALGLSSYSISSYLPPLLTGWSLADSLTSLTDSATPSPVKRSTTMHSHSDISKTVQALDIPAEPPAIHHRALDRRVSKAALDHSRISERTEPDSFMDMSDVSRNLHEPSGSRLETLEEQAQSSVSGEQVLGDLIGSRNEEVLYNLDIPSIPLSPSTQELRLSVRNEGPPLSATSSESSEVEVLVRQRGQMDLKGKQLRSEDFPSDLDDFHTAGAPSARPSIDATVNGMDPDLLTLLSPNGYSFQTPRAPTQLSPALVTPNFKNPSSTQTIMTSTPMKTKRLSRLSDTSASQKDGGRSSSYTGRGDRGISPHQVEISPPFTKGHDYDVHGSSNGSNTPSPARNNSARFQHGVRPTLTRSASARPPVSGPKVVIPRTKDYQSLGRKSDNPFLSPEVRIEEHPNSTRTSPSRPSRIARYQDDLSTSKFALQPRSNSVMGQYNVRQTTPSPGALTQSDRIGNSPRRSLDSPRSYSRNDFRRTLSVDVRQQASPEPRPTLSSRDTTPVTRYQRSPSVSRSPNFDTSVMALSELGGRSRTSPGDSGRKRPQSSLASYTPTMPDRRLSSEGRLYRLDSNWASSPAYTRDEIVRPGSAGGHTSSSYDQPRSGSVAGTLVANTGSHYGSVSTTTSGATLLSNGGGLMSIEQLSERHDLEKEVFITALTDTKRRVREVEAENEAVRRENNDLREYILNLERRVRDLQHLAEERSDPIAPRVQRRAYNNSALPNLGEKTRYPQDRSLGRTTPVRRSSPLKSNTPSPLQSELVLSPRETEVGSYASHTPILRSSSQPTRDLSPNSVIMLNHSRNQSDVSLSIMGDISKGMPLLMNEEQDVDEPNLATDYSYEDDEISFLHDAEVSSQDASGRDAGANLGKTRQRRALLDLSSPASSSLALTSSPGSPSSMMLRTEDEIHLNDLTSLQDESD